MSKRNKHRGGYRPDWMHVCENCGSKPVVPASGLCGPCHFGTAEASGGGWWDDGKDDWNDDFVDEHLPEAN